MVENRPRHDIKRSILYCGNSIKGFDKKERPNSKVFKNFNKKTPHDLKCGVFASIFCKW